VQLCEPLNTLKPVDEDLWVLHFGFGHGDAEHVVVRQYFQPLSLFGGERVDLLLLRPRCVDGFRDVYNLEGGLDAYSTLDDSVPRY
jgi:hypothetical protein